MICVISWCMSSLLFITLVFNTSYHIRIEVCEITLLKVKRIVMLPLSVHFIGEMLLTKRTVGTKRATSK